MSLHVFDRFTQSGERALALAREEARKLGHDYLGTEHLLLGVLGAEEGLGAEILAGVGLTLDDARAEIVRMVGSEANDEGRAAPSTARTMDVLVLAWGIARGRNEVASEDILLALLREGQGVAARVFSHANVTEAHVRAEIIRLRGGTAPPASKPLDQRAPGMFERFTERARQVVVLAQEEARILKQDYIGTEHILLGLLREGEGLAAHVLESFGLTVERVRAEVVRVVGSGEKVTSGQIPFTPRAGKLLELAPREALSLGHNYIGTEHILLGLVRENEGVAARILLNFDADGEEVRNEVIRMLSGPGGRRRSGASGGRKGAAEPTPQESPTGDEDHDPAALSDQELEDMIEKLAREEQAVAYERRILQGKIDILRAELDRRRGQPDA